MREHWEREALNWAAFVRGPERDAYPDYAPRFFDSLPSPGRATLEIGCGEGRVCRDLATRGHRVTGIDGSPTLVGLAREADPAGSYDVADAAALPFGDGAFDLVVAYNSLMDVDDLTGTVREAARVLQPGGRLCACVTHPLADAGRFTRRDADAPFVIEGSYLGRKPFEGAFERNGVTMTFRGWVYPIETYFAALAEAWLLIETLAEPAVPDDAVNRDPAERRWQRIPAFLFLRALKPKSQPLTNLLGSRA